MMMTISSLLKYS